MVAELHKNTPPADQPPAKTDATDKTGTPAAGADNQPSALHADTHGADALDATRQFRLHAEKSAAALPGMELHEELKHDGSAQEYHVKKGDTLSDIARRQLPPNASVHDIYNQVNEIARANHISDPNKIRIGQDLQLPKATAHPHEGQHHAGHDHHQPHHGQHGRRPGEAHAQHPGDGRDHHPAHPGEAPPPHTRPGDGGPTQQRPGDAPPASGPAKPGDAPPAQPHPGDHPPAQPAQPGDHPPANPAHPGDQHTQAGGQPADAATRETPEQKAAVVNTTVDALEKALGPDNPDPGPPMGEFGGMPMGPITDKRKVEDLLKDKSPEEVKAISAAFNAKYGKEHGGRDLETVLESRLDGTDKTKITDIFHRKDKADDAGRVHEALQEMHQMFEGRSRANCEKDIRDTLATMNSTQVDAFKKDYKERYGTNFDDDIAKDTKMHPETKQALAIYEKGSDKRTVDDVQKLADIATNAKNLDMFQEAFRGASQEARDTYTKNGGDDKMKAAFGGWFSDSDLQKARDYVKEGHLDVVTKVQDNKGIFSSNDKAIDTNISGMTQAERDQYMRGKTVAGTFQEYVSDGGEGTTFNQAAYEKLPQAQKDDYDKYRALHEALQGAGNEVKVARWEDMIANHSETLVTKLAQHGGMWSDKVDKTLTDIEGMSKSDFDHLKNDPNYRKQVDAALAMNYSGDDLKKAENLLDTKLAKAAFDNGGDTAGNRSVVDQIKDKESWWNPDTKGMLSAVQNMSPDDQQKYRDNPDFKKQVDKEVQDNLGGTEQLQAATRALERVSKNESPHEDVIDKLDSHTYGSKDTATMLSEIQDSFSHDPKMRDRILNPKTDEDRALQKEFQDKAKENFGDADYKRLVEPLLNTGHVPFAEQAKLYDGFWSNDTKKLYDAIGQASPEDQKAIAADPSKMLSFLTPEQQQLAANIARQGGKMAPEDQMRAAILGESGDKDTIKDLGSLPPEQRAALLHNYETKYKTSLMADLDDKLHGDARADAERSFSELPTTSREAFNRVRDEESVSNDGIGRAFVRNAWDGTSDMSRDDVNQFAGKMESYSSVHRDMSMSDAQKMASQTTDDLDMYKKSKDAAADGVVDGAIIVAGVGGAAFTGGVSLGLIATTGVAGALFKVGTKAAIEGADYDTSNIVADASTGAFDAATMVVGPGELAQVMKLGGKAASVASEMAISEAGNIVAAGGKQLLKEGAEATLSKELTGEVSHALAHGAKEIDEKAMQHLAEKYAANPEDVPAVKQLLTKNLNEAIAKTSSEGIGSTGREVLLNAGAGAAAGGTSSMVKAGTEWDSGKSLSENLTSVAEQTAMGALSGAVMGGGASAGFKGIGKVISGAGEHVAPITDAIKQAKESVLARLTSGAGEHVSEEADTVERVAGEHVSINQAGRVVEIHNPSGGDGVTKVEYHKSGAMEGEPSKISFSDGRTFENVGDGQVKVSSPGNPEGTTIAGEVAVNNKGEVQLTFGNKDTQTLYPDGTSILNKHGSGDVIASDANGQILGVKARGGNVAEIKYSESGNFAGAEYKSGRSITSEDGGKTWTIKDAAGGEPVKVEGEATLDRSGIVHVQPADGGAEQIFRPDGSSSHMDKISGKPSDIVYPDGTSRRFEYDDEGNVMKYTNTRGERYDKSPDGWQIFDKDGKSIGSSSRSNVFEVTADGTFTEKHGWDRQIAYHTDNRKVISNPIDNQVVSETLPAGYARDGMSRGADGRLYEDSSKARDYMEGNFEPIEGWKKGTALKSVETELKDVKAIGPDGKPTNAYDSLMQDPTLSDAQKRNIIDNLSAVREHLAQYRVGDSMHPGAEASWIHTQDEMAKVLELGRAKNLSPTELEDSMLASMYSDSVRFANPAPQGTYANLFTHHLDGALAAEKALTEKGFPAERVDRIVEAIKSSQSAPPQLMGELYYGQISRNLEKAIADNKISAEEGARLKDVLAGMSEKGPDGKTRIKALADVNNAAKVTDGHGGMEVAFTADQKQVFAYSGTDRWSVPYDAKADPNFKQLSKADQAALLSRRKIAQTLIDGDAIDSYATSGGASKIVGMRGPDSAFKDPQVWDALKTADTRYQDAYSVMSPEAQKIADANLKARQELTDAQSGRIKSEMDQWLRNQGHDPSKPIPYYNSDLKYPTATTLAPGEKNLPGLNDQEMKDYLFAREIKAKMADLLRADQRVEGDLPGQFRLIAGTRGNDISRSFADKSAEPLAIPGTKVEDIKPGDTYFSPDQKVMAYREPDSGNLLVNDKVKNSTHIYDADNRIIESHEGRIDRQFKYGESGQIDSVVSNNPLTRESTTLSRNADGKGWTETQVDANGKRTVTNYDKAELTVDADGTVKRYRVEPGKGEVADRFNPDGSQDLVKATGRIEYVKADYAHERQTFDNLIKERVAANPKELQRVQSLQNEFEKQAGTAERDLSENDKALLYKQLNRLLADSPDAAIPMADRVSLAEQVLDHSAHPEHVDQGGNNTCNVTTLEHRAYWRNPDKNAQVIADIAQNGRYQFADGKWAELTDQAGELKPDYEAKRNLLRQQRDPRAELKVDGERDYSSQLLETTMANNQWAERTRVIDLNGKELDRADYALRYDSQGRPLGVVDSAHFKGLYDKDGNAIQNFVPGEKYYNSSKKAIKQVDPDRVMYDKQGRPQGYVDDRANLKQIYDSNGQVITDENFAGLSGAQAYDKNGKLLIAHTKPGDLHYEKAPSGPFKDGERIIADVNGKKVELKDSDGDTRTSPQLYTSTYNEISRDVTGLDEKPFVITDSKYSSGDNIGVSSKDDLIRQLEKMKDEDNLPAVLMVNSSKPPFTNPTTWDAKGRFDGWHVINVQGIEHVRDPKTGQDKVLIKFTNQWGSKNDHLEGWDAQEMFEAMQASPDKPPKLKDPDEL